MNAGMRLFTRNGIYWVEIDRNTRRSLGTRNKAEAQAALKMLKQARFRQNLAVLSGQSAMRLGDFAQRFLEFSQTEKSRATYEADRLALDKLLADEDFGPNKLLTQITSLDLQSFLGRLKKAGLKDSSRAVHYRHLKAAFAKGKEWKFIRENPFTGIKEPKGQQSEPRYLNSEEIDRLLAAENDPAFQRLWRFYLWSGVRRSEALAIEWKHVNFNTGRIQVPRTKNRKAFSVPISPEIAQILKELGGGEGRLFPWQEDSVTHHFIRTARRAGLQVRLHDLRHTFASHLIMCGARLYEVSKLMNHSSLAATQIYAHLDQNYLDETLLKLDFADKTRTAE
jgi:integrase